MFCETPRTDQHVRPSWTVALPRFRSRHRAELRFGGCANQKALVHGGRSYSDLDPPPPWEVVQTTFGPNLASKAPEFFFFGIW